MDSNEKQLFDEFVKSVAESIELIGDVEFWERYRQKIWFCLHKGRSFGDTFSLVFHDLIELKIPAEQIAKVYQTAKQFPAYEWNKRNSMPVYRMIRAVFRKFEKHQTIVSVWPSQMQHHVKFLDHRYALSYRFFSRKLQIFLLDNFHEQKRYIFERILVQPRLDHSVISHFLGKFKRKKTFQRFRVTI